jgi:hypothetical protein
LAKLKQQRGLEGVALRLGLPGVSFLEGIFLQNLNRQQLQSFTRTTQNKTKKKQIFFKNLT